MKRILLTGATGFVGGYLLPELKKQYEVVIYKRNDQLSSLMENIDCVIHLAGKAHDKGATPDDFLINNVKLTEELVKAAKLSNVRRFVFVSTSKVYGEVSDKPWNESSPLASDTDYGKSKITCEKIVADSGMEYVIFRPPLILGGGGRGNLGLLEKAMKLNIPLPSNIANKRSFLNVQYFVKILVDSIENQAMNKNIFNVADEVLSTTDLFKKLGHTVFVPYPRIFLNMLPEYYKTKLVTNYELDTKKFSSIYSYTKK